MIAYKLRPAQISLFSENFFRFKGRLSLNAINPKLLQIVGDIVDYNIQKFQNDSFQVDTSTNFFIQQKFILIHGSLKPFNAINVKILQIIGDTVA